MHSLQCLLVYLARHQESQAKLYCEIQRIMADSKGDRIIISDVDRAHYANAFISEVYRHSSKFGNDAGFILPHIVREDVMLGGRKIPKGTQVR